MKTLLTFRHWQLFLLIFICGAWTSPSPLEEIINVIALVTFILWIYAVGVYGHERITALGLTPMNLKLFTINVAVVGVFFLISFGVSAFEAEVTQPTRETFEFKDVLYTIVGLYVVFAMFQTVIFACKTIAKLELRREVSFSDYLNNLLLMFFFFIGIWFLQPKVTRLIAAEEEAAF